MNSYNSYAQIKLEELRKYLKVYILSENEILKREFALELLLKIGAAQSPEKEAPSLGPSKPSLDNKECKEI